MLASGATRAQAVRGAGGFSPSGASAAVPGSMTSAIRFRPSFAGVSAQTAPKSGARRGCAESWESALTEKRKPCTAPSSGRTTEGPWVAYVQLFPPSLSQNDQ